MPKNASDRITEAFEKWKADMGKLMLDMTQFAGADDYHDLKFAIKTVIESAEQSAEHFKEAYLDEEDLPEE